MKKYILLILAVAVMDFATAQTFEKVFGDTSAFNMGLSTKQLPSGSIFYFGSNDSLGSQNFVLTKFTSSGELVWSKRFGTDKTDNGEYINLTADNNLVVCGQSIDAFTTTSDFVIARLDTNGNLMWIHTSEIAGKNELLEYIEQTDDHGFIACGFITQEDNESNDYLVVKFDSAGTVQWLNTYGFERTDAAHMIRQTADGGYILSGDKQEDGNPGYDVYVLKLNRDGDIEWDLIVGDEYNNGNQAVMINSDGDYIISGEGSTKANANFDLVIAKISKDGKLVWAKNIGKTGSDAGFSIIESGEKGYFICGYSSSYPNAGPINVFFGKLDSNGNSLGVKYFNRDEIGIGYDLQKTIDGQYLIAASTGGKFYLIKTDDANYTDTFLTTAINTSVVSSTTGNMFSIYPNPATGQLYIDLPKDSAAGEIEIRNSTGGVMFRGGASPFLSTAHYPSGIYYLKLITGKGVATQKLLICR